MKCLVNWIPLRIRVRSRNTQPHIDVRISKGLTRESLRHRQFQCKGSKDLAVKGRHKGDPLFVRKWVLGRAYCYWHWRGKTRVIPYSSENKLLARPTLGPAQSSLSDVKDITLVSPLPCQFLGAWALQWNCPSLSLFLSWVANTQLNQWTKWVVSIQLIAEDPRNCPRPLPA